MARPEAEINWELVDDFLIAGSSGVEIAGFLGIHYNTFYHRVKEKYNCDFSEYSQQKKSCGEAMLRKQQFHKALGLTKDGDNTLLIWLGKQRLGQKEPEKTLDKNELSNLVEAVIEINERNRNGIISQSGMENKKLVCDQRPDGQENTVQT